MSIERARSHLEKFEVSHRILEFEVSSATVALAAVALGCEECQIAKTLSFHVNDKVVLIVAAGDTKIDNPKFKAFFKTKAKMVSPSQAEALIGHSVGGICPFGVNEDVEIYLDESLKRFSTVYPACGSSNSAIALNIDELEKYSGFISWIDVTKIS